MNRSVLVLTLTCLFSLPLAADQDALEFLYEPKLEQKQRLLLDRIVTHARNAEFDYALTLSQTLLEQAESLRESRAIAFGQILVNHGIIQSVADDYSRGLTVIERGLALIEQRSNPFSTVLINAVMAKALTEYSLEKTTEAQDSFRRAQHIMHRNEGVYAADQIQIIDWLTKVNLKHGNLSGADREQRFSLRVAEQVYGPDSIELLPILNRLGGYFATRGSTIPPMVPTEARLKRDLLFKYSVDMYYRAVSIIEQNFGENDLRLVQPLRGLASARMLQITNRRDAEAALERSFNIIQSNPDSDTTDRAQALIDLGDLYIITSDIRAADIYLQAWDMLQESADTLEVANAFFGAPVRLFPRATAVLYLERQPDAAEEGDPLFVNLEFTVNSDGKVSRVQVLEKNVPNEQVRLVRQRIRAARYRPRIVDAEIVDTQGLMLHQPFKVLNQKPTSSASDTDPDADKEPDSDTDDEITADQDAINSPQ